MGLTRFSDWTSDEFMAYVNRGLAGGILQDSTNQMNANLFASSPLPDSVDWRNNNVVNPIEDQGGCGSCWAFSAVSTMESYFALATGYLPQLSVQNLVDCTYTTYDGCQGGQIYDGFKYVQSNKGIDTATSYPYVSGITQAVNLKKTCLIN